jgi:hypothetical protein
VPQAIPEPIHATAIVGLHDLTVLVEVRDVAERLVPEAALLEGADPGFRVQLAVESLRERDLLVVGERLISDDEDSVFVHSRPNPSECLAIVNLAKIDPAHLGDEVLVELSECQGHASAFLPQRTPRTAYGFPQRVSIGTARTDRRGGGA